MCLVPENCNGDCEKNYLYINGLAMEPTHFTEISLIHATLYGHPNEVNDAISYIYGAPFTHDSFNFETFVRNQSPYFRQFPAPDTILVCSGTQGIAYTGLARYTDAPNGSMITIHEAPGVCCSERTLAYLRSRFWDVTTEEERRDDYRTEEMTILGTEALINRMRMDGYTECDLLARMIQPTIVSYAILGNKNYVYSVSGVPDEKIVLVDGNTIGIKPFNPYATLTVRRKTQDEGMLF